LPWQRPLPDRETNTNTSTIPENLVKIGHEVSEISLLQAIVKKEVTEA